MCVCVSESVCVGVCLSDLLLTHSDLSTRFPFSEFATSEALERTEVYEYVLSLFSGFGQPDFQVSS